MRRLLRYGDRRITFFERTAIFGNWYSHYAFPLVESSRSPLLRPHTEARRLESSQTTTTSRTSSSTSTVAATARIKRPLSNSNSTPTPQPRYSGATSAPGKAAAHQSAVTAKNVRKAPAAPTAAGTSTTAASTAASTPATSAMKPTASKTSLSRLQSTKESPGRGTNNHATAMSGPLSDKQKIVRSGSVKPKLCPRR